MTYMYTGISLIRKRPPPKTLQWGYALGPMVLLGGLQGLLEFKDTHRP